MRTKLIFRADGSAEIGLGHLYRLLGFHSLIDQMDHYFVTRESSVTHFFPDDILQYSCPNKPEEEVLWLQEHFSPEESIIIADGYHFDINYQMELKKLGYALLIVDDFVREDYKSDIILNPAPIEPTNSFDAKEAYGIDFALLRKEFIEIAQNQKPPKKVSKCFISFGGSDFNKITLKVLNMLQDENKFEEIHVLAGLSVEAELNEFLKTKETAIFVHKNLNANELISVLQNCELAIVPASTISYEVSCCGLFVISGTYVDNQDLIYNGLLKRDLIFGIGDFNKLEKMDLITTIDSIMKLNPSEQNEYLENQKKYFHGQQPEVLNNLIESLI